MTKPLAVIIAPDLVSVDQQSLLNAALYFDVVYADCYSISQAAGENQQVVTQSDSSIEFSVDSRFSTWRSYAPLQDAQILLRPPGADRVDCVTVDLGDALPGPLQRLLSKSIREGAALSVLEFAVKAALTNRRAEPAGSVQSGKPRGIKITLPATINVDSLQAGTSPLIRALALSFQLATMVNTLEVSATCAATPLFDTSVNAELAHAVATQFPAIAAALSRHRGGVLPWNHAALTTAVLNDSLMNVRVRDAEDILYLRELLAPELVAFRAEMSRLAALLRSQPWEFGFAEDAEAIIANNLRPQLAALERRLANPSRRILKHLVSDWKSVSAASLLPFSACAVQGGNIAWAALAGACAGLGLAAIRTKLEEWSIREESALTLLFEVRHKHPKGVGVQRRLTRHST